MAKTIKFNLILDEKPIRNIKGLQENFCIDDVLEFYNNGLLQKWLKVRGFDKELKKVESIKDEKSIIIQLIKIFDIEKSEKEIKEASYSLDFWEERKIELEEWNKKDCKVKGIIADYHNGYDVLKGKIIENKEDMPFMKSATKEIVDKYLEIFKIDYEYFFQQFKDDVPCIIYAILMNKNVRELFLENSQIYTELDKFIEDNEKLYSSFSIFNQNKDENKNTIETPTISSIGNLFKDLNADTIEHGTASTLTSEIQEEIQNKIKLHKFEGETDGYWKNLETADKKIMLLSIPAGTFITTPDNPKDELSVEDVNGKFLIMNGLLYKSNVTNKSIIYMEV